MTAYVFFAGLVGSDMCLRDRLWVGMGWYGLVWVGMGWYGLVWVGMGWEGLVWVGMGGEG